MTEGPSPPSPTSHLKILIWVSIAIFLTAGCGGAIYIGYPAVFQAFELVTRYGELSYQQGDGQWREIHRSDARRQTWKESDAFLQVSWEPAGKQLWYGRVPLRREPNPQQIELVLLRIDPSFWTFAIGYQEAFVPGMVTDIAHKAGMTAAINASFFSEDGPIGLLVDQGKSLHSESQRWAAHLLISKAGEPRIVNEKNVGTQNAWTALQAFPAIMSSGKTFSYMRVGGRGFDVRAVERRSSICITHDRQVILLATDSLTNGLSLSELATVLGGLGCKDAMGLDGGTSTGLMVETPTIQRLIPNLKPVPVVLGIKPAF